MELANRADVEPEDEVQASTKRSRTRREPIGQHVEKPESKPFARSASTTPFASKWTRVKSVTCAGSVGRQRRAVPVLTVRVTRKPYVDRARCTTRWVRFAKICVTRARKTFPPRGLGPRCDLSPQRFDELFDGHAASRMRARRTLQDAIEAGFLRIVKESGGRRGTLACVVSEIATPTNHSLPIIWP